MDTQAFNEQFTLLSRPVSHLEAADYLKQVQAGVEPTAAMAAVRMFMSLNHYDHLMACIRTQDWTAVTREEAQLAYDTLDIGEAPGEPAERCRALSELQADLAAALPLLEKYRARLHTSVACYLLRNCAQMGTAQLVQQEQEEIDRVMAVMTGANQR